MTVVGLESKEGQWEVVQVQVAAKQMGVASCLGTSLWYWSSDLNNKNKTRGIKPFHRNPQILSLTIQILEWGVYTESGPIVNLAILIANIASYQIWICI